MWGGITEVRLSSGLNDDAPDDPTERVDRDPWYGRAGGELFNGVWAFRLLGQYRPTPAAIDIYAIAYRQRALRRPLATRLLLKLQMLATLVHEVAHHDDHVSRRARGRWRMDDEEQWERYAGHLEVALTNGIVVPYLEARYPEEVRDFKAFLRDAGGVDVPLPLVAETIDRNLFAIHFAIFDLLDNHQRRKSPEDQKLEFARDLHYCDQFTLARRALRSLLSATPGYANAVLLDADIAVHQEDFDRAERLAKRAGTLGAPRKEVVEILLDVAVARRDWNGVARDARELTELPAKSFEWEFAGCRLVQAHSELGEFDLAREWLDRLLPRALTLRAQGRLRGLGALLLAYQGDWEGTLAYIRADGGLPTRKRYLGGAELTAAAWIASTRLGVEPEAIPTADDVDLLRHRAYDLCVADFEALGLQPQPGPRVTRDAARLWRRDMVRI
jgi:hypothetical protein